MSNIEMNMQTITAAATRYPWHEKAAYAQFLAQTFYYVRHSTRLLALAAGLIPTGEKKAFDRYIKHIAEERNHELLARHDLKALGYDLDQMPEMPSTRLLWEPQYYKVMHQTPMALLGYILPLEMLAANEGGAVVQLIRQAHGSDCLSFLKLHGEEDIKHVQDALKLAESLRGTDREAVFGNIEQTIYSYATWLDDMAQRVH